MVDCNRQRTRSRTQRAALSLLELLAVITILGILAGVIIPRIGGSTNRAKRDACNQYKAEINSAVERYLFHEGVLPSALGDLENNPNYFSEVIPNCPVTNTPYTLDTTTGRVVGHNH